MMSFLAKYKERNEDEERTMPNIFILYAIQLFEVNSIKLGKNTNLFQR